ncbi:hypothetical protein N7510_005602 [Penicillium lagena]|uniref:uncharacterized protein n=1 Tax=Penicillium lagena TaxID=94218 RepID=UPI00253F964A|nr:uncharacterized protein N7510_005602 [Penicillium lagena]KAJ5612408.1 hypothetical protein N7510_005602 [Penicillium lagena]
MASTTTTAAAAATTTSNSGNNGGSTTSSPLLFFVALGFGVVFTNLWIIVGVKYCFRYNQRNRQLRGEDTGEPIDLVAMPRTHRRRREKKLMTMDEVNERFPLVKYKVWRSSRANQGLPTEGGITAPNSRPNSLKDESGVVSGVVTAALSPSESANGRTESNASQASQDQHAGNSVQPTDEKAAPVTGLSSEPHSIGASNSPQEFKWQHNLNSETVEPDEDEDDGDQIRNALPAELLPNPGDSCAICLDLIEDDDDIRGLTCGHAFHASCVDPWLTSRRACCPLCKADYYIPKPRAPGTENQPTGDRQGRRLVMANLDTITRPSPTARTGHRANPFRTQLSLPGRLFSPSNRRGDRSAPPDGRSQQTPHEPRRVDEPVSAEQHTWPRLVPSRLRGLFNRTSRGQPPSTDTGLAPADLSRSERRTPRELEAGPN